MTAIHRRVAQLKSQADASLIGRVPSGFWVMGETQVRHGYTLLLPDPVVGDLGVLSVEVRARFMTDWGQLAKITQDVTKALRVNMAIFGNVEPALHAHLIPRYSSESMTEITLQPWALDWTTAPKFDHKVDGELIKKFQQQAKFVMGEDFQI